ncbi:MAG TPA: response regulator transcription factor [Ktedonobacterales bacterium]|nr:response regulator transcription factor [Ktedonobacterales bacterium]
MGDPAARDDQARAAVAPRRRILVVDDEASIREVLTQYLELEGFTVLQAADGVEALRSAEAQPPDLIVLDLMLPGMDGLEVCRRLRATSAVPILMLTARSDETDKLAGFAVGADDYVTKPFSPREVVVRVQAIMRRIEATSVPAMVLDDTLHLGNLTIRPQLRYVEREGTPIELTAKEFDLLHFLATHPKQVFTRQQLLDNVWDYGYYGDASTVTVHIRRLREKVELDPARPRHIKTVWGVGYKFEL